MIATPAQPRQTPQRLQMLALQLLQLRQNQLAAQKCRYGEIIKIVSERGNLDQKNLIDLEQLCQTLNIRPQDAEADARTMTQIAEMERALPDIETLRCEAAAASNAYSAIVARRSERERAIAAQFDDPNKRHNDVSNAWSMIAASMHAELTAADDKMQEAVGKLRDGIKQTEKLRMLKASCDRLSW